MIVDDSAVVRGLFARWLESESGVAVVRSVADGAQAVQHIASSQAEVVILDIDMPVMTGLEALPQLLHLRPQAKVLMTSTLTRRNAQASIQALSLGAADYVPKPGSVRGVSTSEEFRRELITKVKVLGALARGMNAREPGGVSASSQGAPTNLSGARANYPTRSGSKVVPKILALGSSTGGPQALTHFFRALGRQEIPVVVTQHMPVTFTAIFAEQLCKTTGLDVREAKNDDALVPGQIYIAPGGFHMTLRRIGAQVCVKIEDGPAENYCKPSVDPMFRSLAAVYGPAVLGVVLTGMGHDGRAGALEIVEAGGSIIVQDEASSVVWGMPGAVAEAGYASAILPLAEIAPKVIGILRGT